MTDHDQQPSAGANAGEGAGQDDGFAAVLPDQSAAVYREFLAGRVIVRQVYDPARAALEDNPLYNLIYNNLAHFRTLYRHLGSELVFNDGGAFFYLRENADEDGDEHDENAFRVQVTLLLIGRYFARSGRDLDYLGRADAGLREEDIASLDSEDEYREILQAARFDKGISEALDYLARRHFLFRSGSNRYFLSSAGMHFLNDLVREYESMDSAG